MGEKEYVAQMNRCGAVVLGQSVFIELDERRSQTFLDLPRQRLAPLGPVDCQELRQLVGPLNDTCQCIRNECAMRRMPRHLTHQLERHMTQLHPLAGFDGQRGDALGRNLGNQCANAGRDLGSLLVELLLPQHAGEDGSPQHLLSGQLKGLSSLMGAQGRLGRLFVMVQLQDVQAHRCASFVRCIVAGEKSGAVSCVSYAKLEELPLRARRQESNLQPLAPSFERTSAPPLKYPCPAPPAIVEEASLFNPRSQLPALLRSRPRLLESRGKVPRSD